MNIQNNNLSTYKNDNNNTMSYLKLNQNGRIFPTWIMKNFKKYILPEIIRKDGEDPCNEKTNKELMLYQKFIGAYLDYKCCFRDLLIYHGLGSGKTVTAINIYNILFNYTPKWNVILLIKASLEKDPWMKDLQNWLTKDRYEERLKNIIFVHYDSPFADREFLEKIKNLDSSKPFLYIIDEVHQFINNVYNNISTKKGKRAIIIYEYIQLEKKEKSNTRILLLSATPAINNPFQLALIFNLLKPDIFPNNENTFNQLYISSSNFASLNEDNKNMFQRRIMGLVSYYLGATPDKYAKKITHYKDILMNPYFEEVYNFFEEQEEKKEQIRRKLRYSKINSEESTYNAYTRQACNFVFPKINSVINGETRPRPGKFKIRDVEARIIDENKNIDIKTQIIQTNKEVKLYIESTKKFTSNLIEYFKNFHRNDIKKKNTIQNDVEKFKKIYKYNFELFLKNEKEKSSLFDKLYECSPKMITIIFNIFCSKGPVLVYSNYVAMEGLQIFKIYLHFFGFNYYNNESSNDYFRYIEYHGGISKDEREKNKSIFNKTDNKYAKIIKIILISPAGSEGINLNNVRQVHIMEPFWNEVRIEQIIGRAIRQCHHKDLPMEERIVDVFRYKMVRTSGKETSDEKLENLSRKKNNLLISFLEAIKEVAIDCELFKSHNMMGSKYKCFQFNEESLLEKPIGPAYQDKLEYDTKINNGLNSRTSKIIKIKVRKIKAVYKIESNSKDQPDVSSYSEPQIFWYFDKNNVVYDFDQNFPVGKIELDNDGNLNKLNEDTYIINFIIDIPTFASKLE
jgi:superfamily II DNA or RNA helicase